MKTLKLFMWFTAHSWAYRKVKGQRLRFITQFIGTWRVFYKLARKEVL